jgi:hypothetical protein
MSRKEIDRLDVIRRVLERRLTQVKAAQLLGLGPRPVGRLCAAYERQGAPGLGVAATWESATTNQIDNAAFVLVGTAGITFTAVA